MKTKTIQLILGMLLMVLVANATPTAIHHWTLNNTDGMVDQAGTWNLSNVSVASGATGQFAEAYDFENDSSSRLVFTGTQIGIGNKTICLWFKPESINVTQRLFVLGQADGSASYYETDLYLSSTNLFYFRACNGGTYCNSMSGTTTAEIGKWYHVCIAHSSTDSEELWVNGTLEKTASLYFSSAEQGRLEIGDYFYYLSGSTLHSSFADGIIDEVWVYDSVLSTSEVQSVMNTNALPPNTAPTISSVTLIPSTPRTQTDENCSAYYEDADADTGTVNFTWYINGAQNTTYDSQVTSVANGTTVYAATLLPHTAFSLNDNITCSAYASDGTDNSGWVNSSTATVKSEPPVLSGSTLYITDLGGSPNVTIRFNVTDADGSSDLDYCYMDDGSAVTAFTSNPVVLDVVDTLDGTMPYSYALCNETHGEVGAGTAMEFNLTQGSTYGSYSTGTLSSQSFNRTDILEHLSIPMGVNYYINYTNAITSGATITNNPQTGLYYTGETAITPIWSGDWVSTDTQSWSQDTSGTKSLDRIDFNDTAYTLSNSNPLSDLDVAWDISSDAITNIGTCTGATWDTASGTTTIPKSGSTDVTTEMHADCFAKEGSYTWAQNTSATKTLDQINFYDNSYGITNYFPSALTVDWDISSDAPSLTGCTGEAWNTSSGTATVAGGGTTDYVAISSHADCFAAPDTQDWSEDTGSTNDPSLQYFQDPHYLLNNTASINLQVDWDVSSESISSQLANCSSKTWTTASGSNTVAPTDLNVTVAATADCIDTSDSGWAEDSTYSHTIDSQKIINTRSYTNNASIGLTLNDSISSPTGWDGGSCDYCTNSSFTALADDSSTIGFYDLGDVITDTQTNNTTPDVSTLAITYGAASANITGNYNISIDVNNTGSYNLTNVNIMPNLPSGWNYNASTVYANLTTASPTASTTVDVYAVAPHAASGSETKEILAGWNRYTYIYTINMTIDEYKNDTLTFTLPTTNFNGWLGTNDSNQLEEVRISDTSTGLSYTEDTTANTLTISVPNTFSNSSLEYGTYQGKVIYLIDTGGSSDAPPSFDPSTSTGGGGGGGGGSTVAISDVLQMSPAYIGSSSFGSIMPNDLIHLPTIVTQNIDDKAHVFNWEFRCSEFDISGNPVSTENCAKDWCIPLKEENGKWVEEDTSFGLQPNAYKNLVISCVVDQNATIGKNYVTSFCVSAEGSDNSACSLIEIPVRKTAPITGMFTAGLTTGQNLLDYGLICFNGADDNCLIKFNKDLTLGNFRITKLPTISHLLAVGGAIVAVGATGGLAIAGGVAAAIGIIFNLLQLVI